MYDPTKVELLLVDDDPDYRGSVARRFLRRGYQVQEASSGPEALALCEGRQFDVVILDSIMPGITGIEVLAKLRAAHSECEVIMLTGQGTIKIAVQAMKLGAYDFLTKPFQLTDLEVLVEKAYERRDGRRALRPLCAGHSPSGPPPAHPEPRPCWAEHSITTPALSLARRDERNS